MGYSLAPLETGVMFWAGPDPGETIAELKALGVRCGQMGVPGELDLNCAGAWKRALAETGFTVYTVFAAFAGEDYADIATVQRCVGFIPPATRAEREARMMAVSDFAAAIGVGGIATHIGFVPEDAGDPDYIAVREMVRRVCGHAAGHGQTFALETGQEPASALLAFLRDAGCANLGINFDPANMILYGTGDPIEALGLLAPHVLSVHCKDGDWPRATGELGVERPLGAGSVGMARYLAELKRIGYAGPLAVEREASDAAQRLRDLAAGIALLNSLKG